MKISAVIGLGFGDEGKGKVTNWLSKDDPGNSLVIRFNGGQQAGHTVVHNGVRHVFSSFGSGTLNGTPTFLSKYCTIFPPALLLERDSLVQKGVNPVLYVDPLTMITTPFDVSMNRYEELSREKSHGSVGSGFGKTVERHETLESSHRIFAKDLFCEWILRQKLEMLRLTVDKIHQKTDIEEYIQQCLKCAEVIVLKAERDIITEKREHIIFEGAQGILLDREHGIFPHVTRSATTSKNIMSMLQRFVLNAPIEMYYLTRCYQTRHGNGPLFGEEHKIKLSNDENETNVTNQWQGEFRKAPLSIDLLDYAIQSDVSYHTKEVKRHIVLSHLDQVVDIPLILSGMKTVRTQPKINLITELENRFNFPVLTSHSEETIDEQHN